MYTITNNSQFNSLEIAFDGKPTEKVRDVLKGMRFRWHNIKKIWYGYGDIDQVKKALDGGEIENQVEPKPKEVKNIYGVKVGDVFYCSWGWEQTNVDFFQVIKLCGEKSVRVRQVQLAVKDQDGCSAMSSNTSYEVSNDLQPVTSYSIFISDQVNGDLKRVRNYFGENEPVFEIGRNGYICHKYDGQKLYESWYA